MRNIVVFETGNVYGNMNSAARFYPEEMTAEERAKDFLERRISLGEGYGFDGHKMFMADQVDKRGTYFEITEEYVEANPNGWTDIREDILIITDKVPGVVIGHPVADCPVVMMEDPVKGVAAIAHCSAELIDKRMPMLLADALAKACDSRDEDILTYVSACAGKNWIYDSFPKWATDKKLWENAIVADKNGIFHIDMRLAIASQLHDRNLDASQIEFNFTDTITDPYYYSNYAASPYGLNDQSKAGRNFAGLFYPEENKKLVKSNRLR